MIYMNFMGRRPILRTWKNLTAPLKHWGLKNGPKIMDRSSTLCNIGGYAVPPLLVVGGVLKAISIKMKVNNPSYQTGDIVGDFVGMGVGAVLPKNPAVGETTDILIDGISELLEPEDPQDQVNNGEPSQKPENESRKEEEQGSENSNNRGSEEGKNRNSNR
ncbi:hypothetical protein KAR48_06045 [bacterium]|nr:hypothetical protein [bacterium]